jgi:hypothetical protein
MTTSTTLIPVPFRNTTLTLIDHNGEPYVAMRRLVEAMGMDWKAQFDKILRAGSRFSASVVEITTQLPGDQQNRKMICLPLRKLTGWLMTISPNKVRPELRERIQAYQAECDDALWKYWTQGHASRPAPEPAPALPAPKAGPSKALRAHINRKAHEVALKQYDTIHAILTACAVDNLACGATDEKCFGYVDALSAGTDGTVLINLKDLQELVWHSTHVINTAADSIATIKRIEQRSGFKLTPRIGRSKWVNADYHKNDRLVEEVIDRMVGIPE